MKMKESCYPNDVKAVKRDEILKCIFTADPKAKRNKCVEENMEQIKEAYPIVKWTEKAFHTALIEKDPSRLDEFLEKYAGSSLDGFCENIKRISPRQKCDIPGNKLWIR